MGHSQPCSHIPRIAGGNYRLSRESTSRWMDLSRVNFSSACKRSRGESQAPARVHGGVGLYEVYAEGSTSLCIEDAVPVFITLNKQHPELVENSYSRLMSLLAAFMPPEARLIATDIVCWIEASTPHRAPHTHHLHANHTIYTAKHAAPRIHVRPLTCNCVAPQAQCIDALDS